jgi:integrase
MPRLKLTKSGIDALPTPAKDLVYWDAGHPGFGVKVTPRGRKVFIVLYRVGGAGSRQRKYTIGVHGRITLHQARVSALKIFSARSEGRDPASERQESRRRLLLDRVDDTVECYIREHVAKTRSAGEISRLLHRELIANWGSKSVHKITKREVINLVMQVNTRGAPSAANKLLKIVKAFFNWCVGRAILDHSPAEQIRAPSRESARDRVLSDDELVRILNAARLIGDPYAGIVELLALTGQRREEIARLRWDEVDFANQIFSLASWRTKNGKPHTVHLSTAALSVLRRQRRMGTYVFSSNATKPFGNFSAAKRRLSELSGVMTWRLHDLRRTCVSGMAALGVAPHVADKILNHQSGTISGVAAVYQRHEFLVERKDAMHRWGVHMSQLTRLHSEAA